MIELKTITLYNSLTDTRGKSHYNLNYLLALMKNGDFGLAEKIQHLRTLTGEEYRNYKRNKLPMFVGGGDFKYRAVNGIVAYSNILILDFDWDETVPQQQIVAFKGYLIRHATSLHLYAVWLSPGHGVKAALIHDNTNPDLHPSLFWAVKNDLFVDAPLDKNCSDVSRACFLSYDPELFINEDDKLEPYHFAPTSEKASMVNERKHYQTTTSKEFIHTEEEIALNRTYQNFCTDKKLMNYLVKSFNSKNPDYYKDGNRHSELKRRAVIYVKDGILYENAVWSLIGQFGEHSWAGLDNQHIRSLVTSIYNLAREDFGKERYHYLQKRKQYKQ